MKILVLMPCDERSVYAATAIYKLLPQNLQEHTFSLPMYMEYLKDIKLVKNDIEAFYYSMMAAQKIVEATQTNENLIIFGNISNKYQFDAIFSFQDLESTLSYEDKFIDKVIEISKEEEILHKYTNNLYTASDVVLPLTNCQATATFLTKYISSDPKLDEIKILYENILDLKEA